MASRTFDRAVKAVHLAHEVQYGSPLHSVMERARAAIEQEPEVLYVVEGGHIVQGSSEAVFFGDDGELTVTSMSESSRLEWVKPIETTSAAIATGFGPRFRAAEFNQLKAWRTKAQARKGAKAIGWPAYSPEPVHTRLSGLAWALKDAHYGYLSRKSYEELLASMSESLDEDAIVILGGLGAAALGALLSKLAISAKRVIQRVLKLHKQGKESEAEKMLAKMGTKDRRQFEALMTAQTQQLKRKRYESSVGEALAEMIVNDGRRMKACVDAIEQGLVVTPIHEDSVSDLELELTEHEVLIILDWQDALREAVDGATPALIAEYGELLGEFERDVAEGNYEHAESIAEVVCEALQLDEYAKKTMSSRMSSLRSRRSGVTAEVKSGKKTRTEVQRSNRAKRKAMKMSPSKKLQAKRYRRRTSHHAARRTSLTARESVQEEKAEYAIIAGAKKRRTFGTRASLLKWAKENGFEYTGDHRARGSFGSAPILQGAPKFSGIAGPMNDGGRVRYETQASQAMSISRREAAPQTVLDHVEEETREDRKYRIESGMTDVQLDALAAFGIGPRYLPKPRKTHECPECKESNAYWHEAHADTGMDEMVLRCPDCGSDTSKNESVDEDTNAHGIEFGERALLAMWEEEDDATKGTFEEWRAAHFTPGLSEGKTGRNAPVPTGTITLSKLISFYKPHGGDVSQFREDGYVVTLTKFKRRVFFAYDDSFKGGSGLKFKAQGYYDERSPSLKQLESLDEKAPPGFKGTVKAMKADGIPDERAFALAWSMYKKGAKSHRKADGSPKNEASQNYANLNDAVIHEAGYTEGVTEVWYRKPGTQASALKDLAETHVLVGTLDEKRPEAVFGMMQGARWSPNGEARTLITELGLTHTSMGIGDVVKVGQSAHICEHMGFKKLR